MSLQTQWFSRRHVQRIAMGFAVTERRPIVVAHLYDRKSDGTVASGAYGANLIRKLAAEIGWTEDALARELLGNEG